MTSSPITLVIPVYNRKDLVLRTLDSVYAQQYRPLRVVLVDNGSTDGTYETLCEWRDKVNAEDVSVEVIKEPKSGATAARNAGLRLVDTPWVMFFDSDDTMVPEHIGTVIDTIERNPDADIVGWDVRLRFLDGNDVVKPFKTTDLMYNCIIHGTFATQRYAIRTDIVRSVGAWNEGVMAWNDIELATRILTRHENLKVLKISNVIPVDVYQTAESITGMSNHEKSREREYAMRTMLLTVKPRNRYYIAIKAITLAASYYREGYANDARHLRESVLAMMPFLYKRVLLRLAYLYSRHGGRGVARILKLFA